MGMDEWNHIKFDAENRRHNMIVHDGLVCHSHGANSYVIVIPFDMKLKHLLMHNHHDSPILVHLGIYCIIGSLLSYYYWRGLYADYKDYCKKCLTCQASKVSM